MKTLFLMSALSTLPLAQSEPPPPSPEAVVEIGGSERRLEEVEDRQVKRARQLKVITGNLVAQEALSESFEAAYTETGDGIYLLHALHSRALFLRERIRLSGEAIANLAALDASLASLPLNESGIFIEQRLKETSSRLEKIRAEYHGTQAERREGLKAAFLEVFALHKSLKDLRKTLEGGDESIREHRNRIAADIEWLESRVAKDALAKGLLEARLPVVMVELEIKTIRKALTEVKDATGVLEKSSLISKTSSAADEAEALRVLEDPKLEVQP